MEYVLDCVRWRLHAAWSVIWWLCIGLPKQGFQCDETGEWVEIPRMETIWMAWPSWRSYYMWKHDTHSHMSMDELRTRLRQSE
jgi:hypothetical protein